MNEGHSTRTQTDSLRYKIKLGYQILKQLRFKKLRSLYILLFLFVLAGSALAQQSPAAVDDAKQNALRASGLEALYNLDYEKAQREFKELDRLYPTSPAGPQLLAARVWIKTLYESRRLQASLYSSESFYSSGDDKADPKMIT